MFPTSCEYFCQENAWMDKDAMLVWVEKILEPFIATEPENVIPLFVGFLPMSHDGIIYQFDTTAWHGS